VGFRYRAVSTSSHNSLGVGYISPSAIVSSTAQVHQGAWVGEAVEVGAGASIGPGSVVGFGNGRNAGTTRIGDKAYVGPGVHIEAGVVIGAECRLEAGSFLGAGALLGVGTRVGPHCILMGCCRIDDDVHLYAEVHVCEFAELKAHARLMPGVKLLNDPCPPTNLKLEGPVVGKCAVIGVNSIIWSGVHVGDHAVVASTSVVKNNVPDYMLVRGSPARPICDTRRIQMKLDGRWVYPYPWVRHFIEGEEITMPWGSPDKSSAP